MMIYMMHDTDDIYDICLDDIRICLGDIYNGFWDDIRIRLDWIRLD